MPLRFLARHNVPSVPVFLVALVMLMGGFITYAQLQASRATIEANRALINDLRTKAADYQRMIVDLERKAFVSIEDRQQIRSQLHRSQSISDSKLVEIQESLARIENSLKSRDDQ